MLGSGGVGKTTIAAALGLAAAVEQGGRVLVLTVDPAKPAGRRPRCRRARQRRQHGCPTPRSRRPASSRAASCGRRCSTPRPGGTTSSAATPPTPRSATPCSANPLYQNITSRFVHSHDYLAMEQLHDLHASGEYDLVVVDTPPSRNALSVLDAPARMREFFGSRLLRWLTVPYRSRLFTVASKPFYQIADRVLGSGFLRDIADFFVLFQAMEKGFVARAREVEALLGDARTTFLVVSTLETAPAHEAAYLARELLARDYDLGAVDRQPRPADGADAARRGDQRQAPRRGGGRRLARRRRRRRARRRRPRRRRARRAGRAHRGRRAASTTSPSSRRARPSGGPSWRRWPHRSSTCRRSTPTSTTSAACMALVDHLRALTIFGQTPSPIGLPRRPRPRQHDARPRAGVAPQPADVGVGHARRLLLRRPDALRADEGRALADRRPGPPGHRPDRVPHRLGRHVRQRQRALRAVVVVHVRRDHRGRRRGRGPARTRPACWPCRCAATAADRRADARVGAARRAPAGRAGADVRVDLRPLRRDDRRGLVPVPGPRRRLDGGAHGSATA